MNHRCTLFSISLRLMIFNPSEQRLIMPSIVQDQRELGSIIAFPTTNMAESRLQVQGLGQSMETRALYRHDER